MEPNQAKIRMTAKDFFLNLGAVIALYTVVFSLLNLLFTIIDVAYPPITNGYGYYYSMSQSISWPVAMLIIFFPILIILMWVLEKEFTADPDRKNVLIRKWLSWITLFVAGATLAGDLVAVLYYFIDGQALTTGFLLKVLAVLVVSACVFLYYVSDIRDTLTSSSRKIWRIVSMIIVIGSIIWGFSVLGSPRTQRFIKYDLEKVNDLQSLNSQVLNFYQVKGFLPANLGELAFDNRYYIPKDIQTSKPYEYILIGQSAKAYQLCAEFNRESEPHGYIQIYPDKTMYWDHPAGKHCFSQTIDSDLYPVNKIYSPAAR